MSDGAYYFQEQRPEPADLLAVPPFEVGVEYQPACGTGAFLAHAERVVTEAKT
jgi:type I restriction-modification system DNA methylase subunit